MPLSKVEVTLPAVGANKRGELVNGEVLLTNAHNTLNLALSDELIGCHTIRVNRDNLAQTLRVLEEAQRVC